MKKINYSVKFKKQFNFFNKKKNNNINYMSENESNTNDYITGASYDKYEEIFQGLPVRMKSLERYGNTIENLNFRNKLNQKQLQFDGNFDRFEFYKKARRFYEEEMKKKHTNKNYLTNKTAAILDQLHSFLENLDNVKNTSYTGLSGINIESISRKVSKEIKSKKSEKVHKIIYI